MRYYLFAKFFRHLSAMELMERCAELGLDGPTALIRAGYWVDPEAVGRTLPGFVRAAEGRGLRVRYADTDWDMATLDRRPDDLKALRDAGIEKFRVGHVRREGAGHPRELAERVRALTERTCEIAARFDLQAIVQIHGHMYPLNASTAYPLVRNLDPRHIGVKIDFGNNCSQEGYELPDYQIPLLGEYVQALGAKDGAFVPRGGKDWRGTFLPAYEGMADFPRIFALLKEIRFDGPAVLMPFYDEDDFPALCEKLRKEIAYLKKAAAEVGL